MNHTQTLADYISKNGPIRAARISSTQTGSSCPWPYWDVVPYVIRLRVSDGHPISTAQGRAGFGTRSTNKAERMLAEYCEKTGRIPVERIGAVTEEEAKRILELLV